MKVIIPRKCLDLKSVFVLIVVLNEDLQRKKNKNLVKIPPIWVVFFIFRKESGDICRQV